MLSLQQCPTFLHNTLTGVKASLAVTVDDSIDGARVCVLLHMEHQQTHFIRKVRTNLGNEDILSGHHNFRGWYVNAVLTYLISD